MDGYNGCMPTPSILPVPARLSMFGAPRMSLRRWVISAGVLLLVASGTTLASVSSAGAAASPIAIHSQFKVNLVATGTGGQVNPDDVAVLGKRVFIGYQNGVGAMGEPASGTGQTQSTVVEYSLRGKPVASWNVIGKVDGLGEDVSTNEVLATVNEDGNSSIYAIHPLTNQVVHLTYNVDPASLGGGGTDAVAVNDGQIFIGGSNPSAANAPALYTAVLNETSGVATLTSVFNDNASASGPGGPVTLALTDPDSNAVVPFQSPRFGGDVVLNSQGDSKLIFAHHAASAEQTLTQLPIPTQIDDITWATSATGKLYLTDNKDNRLYTISTASFVPGTVFIDTASDSSTPGFVGTLNLTTGQITPVVVGFSNPHGLRFVPDA